MSFDLVKNIKNKNQYPVMKQKPEMIINKLLFLTCSEASDIPKLSWHTIFKKYKGHYNNILSLIELLLTLPASSAEVERGFSQLKMLKSNLRSRLGEGLLNNLLAIKLLSCDISTFDAQLAIHLWSKQGTRAKRPLFMDHDQRNPDDSSTGLDTQHVPEEVGEVSDTDVDHAEDIDYEEGHVESLIVKYI